MNDLTANALRAVNKFLLGLMTSNRPGKYIFRRLGEPYMAGHNLNEGMNSIGKYSQKRRHSTFDILGEAAKTVAESDRYVETYIEVIDRLAYTYGREDVSSVSVKPTAICAVNEAGDKTLDETPLEERLERIVKHAHEKGINVTLDMEDHPWTDESLDVAQSLWRKGYDNLGIVLQSRLNRNGRDIRDVLKDASYDIPKEKIRVRACIGIYTEPEDIATNSKSEAKLRLIEDIQNLYKAGVYVEVATHDHKVIREVVEMIEQDGADKSMFEFQFLKGVQNGYNIEKELMDKGFKVRYYMPTEIGRDDGMPYMERRLIANPGMMISAAKNMAQAVLNYVTPNKN